MKKLFTLALIAFSGVAANAQQQNAGFENWITYTSDTATLERPEYWTGTDSLTYAIAGTIMASPAKQVFEETTHVNSGSSAAKIVSHDISSFLIDVVPGVIANGEISVNILDGSFAFTGGAPVTERIGYVNAYVDYQPENDDMGMMMVQAVLAGQGIGGADSIVGGGTFSTDGTNGYEQVSVMIQYIDPNVIPDHIQIAFFSSEEIGSGVEGSTMYIDDITLSPVSVKKFAANNNAVICFPNPTTGMFNVRSMVSETLNLEVYSITGQVMHTQSFKGQAQADLSAFSNGMYFYKVSNAAGQVVKQDKLVLNK